MSAMPYDIKVSLHGGDFISNLVFNDYQCHYKIYLSEIVKQDAEFVSCPVCSQTVDIRPIKNQINPKINNPVNKYKF